MASWGVLEFCPPGQFTHYLLAPNSNTSVGGGPTSFHPVVNNFQIDIHFQMSMPKMASGAVCTLNINLSDAGLDYPALDFVFTVSQSAPPTFAIYEKWVENDFYVTKNRPIVVDSPMPFAIPQPTRENLRVLSIRRVGSEIRYIINDTTLQQFEAPVFDIKKMHVGGAAATGIPCHILLISVEIREPV